MIRGSRHLIALTATLLATSALTATAHASHFRGAAMVPSVSASGLLTVTATTFWRTTAVADIDEGGAVSVAGVGSMTQQGAQVNDTSDSRFTKVTSVHTIQLPGAGTYDISATSCCRIAGIQNSVGGSSVAWLMDSQIFWNGTTANTPILFDFAAIQPEVVRGANYADNLGAVSGNAGTLSYDQALNTDGGGNFNQTPGFTVNPATGALAIPAASTMTLTDNLSNPGGDYFFSGNIFNSDGSRIEFDWLFDAVDIGQANLAPDVSDHVINALVGDNIAQIVTGTDNVDAIADDVTLGLLSFFGPGINMAATFAPGAPGDPTMGTFSWNTTGSTPGQYIVNIQGSDGSLTDVGTIIINLQTTGAAPEPATLGLLGLGFAGMGVLARRRRQRG